MILILKSRSVNRKLSIPLTTITATNITTTIITATTIATATTSSTATTTRMTRTDRCKLVFNSGLYSRWFEKRESTKNEEETKKESTKLNLKKII